MHKFFKYKEWSQDSPQFFPYLNYDKLYLFEKVILN